MHEVSVHPFGPDDAVPLEQAVRLREAARSVDTPWEHPELPGNHQAFLRYGWDGEPPTPYLMQVDGEAVAVGSLTLPQRDNRHLAWISVVVDPAHRRHGHGRRLADHLMGAARGAGRTSVGLDGWESQAARGFADALGFECRSQAIMRRQHLREVDLERVRASYHEAAAAAGAYELLRIDGRTPPELREDMVGLADAINDAPTDELDIEDEVMSVERLDAYESACEARGNRIRHLVARHRETGALGGHTIVVVEEDRPTVGHQHDTAVARGHRGHRLGLLLKSAMVLWLAGAEPQLETVDTFNAESNDHMIRVNEVLGYRVMARELQFQRSL